MTISSLSRHTPAVRTPENRPPSKSFGLATSGATTQEAAALANNPAVRSAINFQQALSTREIGIAEPQGSKPPSIVGSVLNARA